MSEPTYLDVILDYEIAHSKFLNLTAVIPEIRCAVCHAYAGVVVSAPRLAKMKFYDDCQEEFRHALQHATGEVLEAYYIWTFLSEDFWDRMGDSGGCAPYVSTWEVCRIQGLRLQVREKMILTKPWRRTEKGKIKPPKSVELSEGQWVGFH